MEDKLALGKEKEVNTQCVLNTEDPLFMEDIEIEELSVDGICGVY